MKHYGDICKLNGAKMPVVDIITGGSPCQDLSVAGKRAGLAGERSGLFMEQIRIIKEMRENDKSVKLRSGRSDESIRPRYMVWENVCGAFSSNGGEDFRVVLEETARIADETAVIPKPPKGKWSNAGCIMGNGWSIAWRLHNAEFWGTPQRRRRISLVADFGGESAPEILFERKGVSGNFSKGETEGQGTTPDIGADPYKAISFQERAGKPGGGKGLLIQNERTGALSTGTNQSVLNNSCLNPWDVQSKHIQTENGKAEALYSGECRYGGGESYVLNDGTGINGDVSAPLDASYYKGCGERAGIEREVVCVGNGQLCNMSMKPVANSLDCMHDQQAVMTYGICSDASNAMKSSNPHSGIYEADTARTLDMNGGNPSCNQGGMAIVQPMVCIEGNGSRDSHKGDGYKESETMYTLNTVEQHAVCYGLDRASFNQGQNAQYDFAIEEEKAPTLVSKGPGGGTSEIVGALCARDFKGVGNQYVDEGKCIVQRCRSSHSQSE